MEYNLPFPVMLFRCCISLKAPISLCSSNFYLFFRMFMPSGSDYQSVTARVCTSLRYPLIYIKTKSDEKTNLDTGKGEKAKIIRLTISASSRRHSQACNKHLTSSDRSPCPPESRELPALGAAPCRDKPLQVHNQ